MAIPPTQQKRRWEIPTKYGVTALTQKCHLIWSACPTSCTGGPVPLIQVGLAHLKWWDNTTVYGGVLLNYC